MEIFDAHCHIGEGSVKRQAADVLLRSMDENGVQRAVVVPVEEHIAVYNEEGNDAVLEAVRTHEGRLFGFAVANPWYGAKASALLGKYLGRGLCGVKFNPMLQGFRINDEIVYPLIEVAARHKVPVYFHTGTPVTCMPFQLYELAKRYPEVNFIMGHSGWSDFWQDIPYIAKNSRNIWFETSLSYTSRTEEAIGCNPGGDHILFGSDSPHSSLAMELRKARAVRADDAVRQRMFAGNLRFLLGV